MGDLIQLEVPQWEPVEPGLKVTGIHDTWNKDCPASDKEFVIYYPISEHGFCAAIPVVCARCGVEVKIVKRELVGVELTDAEKQMELFDTEDEGKVMAGVTDDRNDPGLKKIGDDGMQETYLVLSEEERKKGFVRPVRRSYIHLKCGIVTTMGQAIAETYARDPHFYSGTFCVGCGAHYPVGENGEFVWDRPREGTPLGMQDKVGT